MSDLLVLESQLTVSEDPQASQANTSHPKNALNNLSGAEWLQETKSFFFQKGLGNNHPHAKIERLHPAPFSYQDVQRLILFFTKEGQTVLDPFSGVGSTVKACALSNRIGVGIELSGEWNALAYERLELEVRAGEASRHRLICGDAREVLRGFSDNSFDFIVTSPPYWSILNKRPDHKALERVTQSLATSYSEDPRDLGNIECYDDFLTQLTTIFCDCARVLKPNRYMALIVSDFRHKSRFHAFHSDLIQRLDGTSISNNARLILQGVKVLLQNHKGLKPYGYPFAYVENIHHQYILVFRREMVDRR
jgi:DNA modification methylase